MDVDIEGFRFGTDYANPRFLIEIVDRTTDHFLVRSYANDLLDSVNKPEHISWQLDDSTGLANTSVALPFSAPNLAAWTSSWGLRIDGPHSTWSLVLDVTSATVRPH
jgi:hypothetical protein